jgi:hypothetical protein
MTATRCSHGTACDSLSRLRGRVGRGPLTQPQTLQLVAPPVPPPHPPPQAGEGATDARATLRQSLPRAGERGESALAADERPQESVS